MNGSIAGFAFAFVLVFVQICGNDIPYIDLSTVPVPGKLLQPLTLDQPVVKTYEFKYTGWEYSFKTRWLDGKYHMANGTLINLNGTHMYREEGVYVLEVPDETMYRIKYVIDQNGYQELSRNETELVLPRVSRRAIGSLLG